MAMVALWILVPATKAYSRQLAHLRTLHIWMMHSHRLRSRCRPWLVHEGTVLVSVYADTKHSAALGAVHVGSTPPVLPP